MKFKEIQKYLHGDCVVRNYDFEYKTEGNQIYRRIIGTLNWSKSHDITHSEKIQEWELVEKI